MKGRWGLSRRSSAAIKREEILRERLSTPLSFKITVRLGHGLGGEGNGDRLLGRKVVEQRPRGDPGGHRDLASRRGLETHAGEQILGRLQNAAPCDHFGIRRDSHDLAPVLSNIN